MASLPRQGVHATSAPAAAIRWALVAVAVALAAAALITAIARVAYPYDIDFVEDGMLMQAWRVAGGLPIYVAPSAGFAPHVYMPLYTWLGGLLLAISGPSLAPLRLVSLLATLATASLVALIGWRESRSALIALVGGALYLAGYRIVGGWYDLARVDALFIALTVAGLYAVIYWRRSAAGQLAAALLLALAYLTKQNGLYFGVIAAGYLLVVEGRRGLLFMGAFAALVAASTVALNVASQGWFSTYVFGIAFASPTEWQRALYSLGSEVFGDMAILALLFVALALISLAHHRRRVLHEQPWLLFIAAAIAASVAGRASVGGARNQLMQAYALLCLTPALMWRELARSAPTGVQAKTGQSETSRWAKPALELALVAQFALTLVSPVGRLIEPAPLQHFVPTAAMRHAGDQFVADLAATPGDVLVMMHPYYALKAGKQPAAQIQALWHARWRGRDPLPADLVARIENREYAEIISDESPYFETEPALAALIDANYVPLRHLTQQDAPATLNGLVVRPQTIYVPRP